MAAELTRREFIGAPPLAAASSAAAGKRPNVILLLTDDQGYGDLACHGNPHIRTPHLDRLHAGSVRFTDFHVDPTCAPTRSALMTGRYSHRTGVWHTIMGRNYLGQGEITMADVFRASGYRTGNFGKWHLGGNYPFRPIDRGFDEWVGHGDGGTGTATDYWGNHKLNDTYLRNGKWEQFGGFGTDIFFDEAMRFIEQDRRRPFFVYLATNDPHEPCNVKREWLEPYQHSGLNRGLTHFYSSIERVDTNLGRLRAFLARKGLARNTILLFLTDNGTARRENFAAGMRGIKGSVYDGGHRVPLFLRLPNGVTGGRNVGRLTAHIDLLPTLIELCGLQPPEAVRFDGRSLVPLIRGGSWTDRALLVESQRIPYPRKWRDCAVMTDRWRLVGGQELYDMAADPGQKIDVAGHHPEVVRSLRDRYEALWEQLSTHDREFCRIVIGSAKQPEARLTGHDWLPTEGPNPLMQGSVLQGTQGNGFWPLEVLRGGVYRFALRRWPKEADRPITASARMATEDDIVREGGTPPDGVPIPVSEARIRSGQVEQRAPVTPEDREIAFEIGLQAGPVDVQTWFTGGGQSRGAYYTYITRVG